MFALTNKPDMGARLYSGLIMLAKDPVRGVDAMKVIQHMAGILTETYFVFESPDGAMQASFGKLSEMLGCEPVDGALSASVLPPAHVMDLETERGRAIAREFFEEWLDCSFEFHELILTIIHNVIVSWEGEGVSRAESLRLLIECTWSCMGFELAAQELCDVVIEKKVTAQGWSLADCIAALSAVAGRYLAVSLNAQSCDIIKAPHFPVHLDSLVYVMTQEAVRLGVPAGSDWRFGLAANDVPVSAPYNLIHGIEPWTQRLFEAMHVECEYGRAVACAKAAGRMLAVAAGGEAPEMEPVIAKPLAMAAITETYKSICMEYQIATC